MWLLVSWAHCSSTVKSSLADSEHLHDWLKKLTLLIPEVSLSQHRLTPVSRETSADVCADVDLKKTDFSLLFFICASGSF